MSRDTPGLTFAGELFLSLAAEGRLVVDAARADEMIAELERTLVQIRARQRLIRGWQKKPGPCVGELVQDAVDALFLDQLVPGQLEKAAVELPKYIAALRRARR